MNSATRWFLGWMGLCWLGVCVPALATDWGEKVIPGPPWQEQSDVPPPRAPVDEELLPVALHIPESNFRFLLDPPAIAIGSDRVVRYTVVIETPGGTRNVLYEGIRCGKHRFKTYYYLGADGKWARMRNAEWKKIDQQTAGSARFRDDLYRHFLCDDYLNPLPARDILHRLRFPPRGALPAVAG